MSQENFIAKESVGLVITFLSWLKNRYFIKSFKWNVSYDISWRFNNPGGHISRKYYPSYSFLAHDVIRLKDMIVLSLDNDLDDERGRYAINIRLGRFWYWPCSWIWPWSWSWDWFSPCSWSWPWSWNWPWYHSRRLKGCDGHTMVTFLSYPAEKIEWCGGLVNRKRENSIWFGIDKSRFKEIINHFSSGENLTIVISNPKTDDIVNDSPIVIHFDLSNFKEVVQRRFSQLESIAAKKKMRQFQSMTQSESH